MNTQAPTLTVIDGTTYRFGMVWRSDDANATPVDLTGCEARLVVASAKGALLLSAETGDGIQLTPEQGGINVHIRPEQTAGRLTREWSGARYELRITFPNGDVFSLLRGHFQLLPGVYTEAAHG